MADYDILCIGEVNVDLVLSGVERLPRFGEEVLAGGMGMHVGGCTANVATFMARLGMRAALRARVGRDDFGDFAISELERAGVSTEFILRDDSLRTGLSVSLSGLEDRAFVTYVGTIDSLTRADVDDDLLARARHAHIGSFYLQRKLQPDIRSILGRARELGLTTSLDTGYDPFEKWDSDILSVLDSVDVFLPNEMEACEISGQSQARLGARKLAEHARRVALKLGAEGSMLFSQVVGGEPEEVFARGFRVKVVDTTCCGDAFNAGFITAMLQGDSPEECLRRGNASGAIVAGGSGTSAERLSSEAIAAQMAS
jgi:sugar/nucleoside kinase (ribokinase family)